MSTSAHGVTDDLIHHAANLTEPAEPVLERREHDRHSYRQIVSLTLLSPDGKPAPAVDVQAVDISKGGLCVESRTVFCPGAVGIARLPRSDGKNSLVGVQVCHCRYFGNMLHHTGLRFIPLPQGDVTAP